MEKDLDFRPAYQHLVQELSCFADTLPVARTALGVTARLSVSITSRLADRYYCRSVPLIPVFVSDDLPAWQPTCLWARVLISINLSSQAAPGMPTTS